MLQTATAYARGNGLDKAVEERILFDSGSQRSYVNKNLREKLKLPSTKSETLHLNRQNRQSVTLLNFC